MEEAVYHVPVLLKECVDGLVVNPAGVYADVTFGGGGHSRAIVSRLDTVGHLYSFDQDEDAEANIVADGRFTFVRSNFRYLKNWWESWTACWLIWACRATISMMRNGASRFVSTGGWTCG